MSADSLPDARTATFRDLVAAELRAHLARRRISHRRLAAMLDVKPAWVDRRLNGTTALDTDDLQRIAEVLGMTPMDLLAGVPFEPAVHRRTAAVTSPAGRISGQCSGRRLASVIVFPQVRRSPHPDFGEDAA